MTRSRSVTRLTADRVPSSSSRRQSPQKALAVQYRLISSLHPDPRNPRVHSPRQVRQIARSIETFGFVSPVLIDAVGTVIAGHGRLLAAEHLGWREVPSITLSHLSPAQVQAYRIADNRLTECSAWDEGLLAEQLRDLAAVDLDFELEVTGFDMGEIDLYIEGLSVGTAEGEPDPADTLPEASSGPAVSREGDLWILGPHRVFCGDALDATSYDRLLGSRKAAVVFTDPPYNVPIAGHVSGLGAVKHRDFRMASGEMDEAAFTDFLSQALTRLARSTVKGALHYICMDWRHVGELLRAGRDAYDELLNLCVWVKGNGGMGSLYRSEHELVFVFKRGRASHRNNVQLGQFGRYRTNVWRYPGANSFARETDEGNLLAMHPTVKPVALVADALLDASARGDLVLDAFLGSGTTLIAAERTGRRCYGIELDPLYVDIAIRRWQSFTGSEAIHAASGKSYHALGAGARQTGSTNATAPNRTAEKTARRKPSSKPRQRK